MTEQPINLAAEVERLTVSIESQIKAKESWIAATESIKDAVTRPLCRLLRVHSNEEIVPTVVERLAYVDSRRIAQAHDPDGVPLWMHLCGYVEAFDNVPLDEVPFGGGCDRCDSGYPQRGDWRPLLVEASPRPPGPAKVRPTTLCLPEVPADAVTLRGARTGASYPKDGDSWGFNSLGEVLDYEGTVTVESGEPR